MREINRQFFFEYFINNYDRKAIISEDYFLFSFGLKSLKNILKDCSF